MVQKKELRHIEEVEASLRHISLLILSSLKLNLIIILELPDPFSSASEYHGTITHGIYENLCPPSASLLKKKTSAMNLHLIMEL